MSETLATLRRYTDSMENVQLYLMPISNLIAQLNCQMQVLGLNMQALERRISRLEAETVIEAHHEVPNLRKNG